MFDKIDRLGEGIKTFRNLGEAALGVFSQGNLAVFAVKQLYTQNILEKFDLLADRRGCNKKLLGSIFEAQVPRRRLKGAKCI